jgi:adenylate cyclase
MALIDDLSSEVNDIINKEWSIRDGQVIPKTDDVALAGGAVQMTATVLYADLADSTDLAIQYDKRVAAKVIKCFLSCCSRLIKFKSGEIRSFDGDRVMGVFIGKTPNSEAAECALKINYVFKNIIKPKLENKYPSLKSGNYKLAHCVGIDTSEMLVVRGGVRNNNDLVWIGRAPNIAAKLSGRRNSPYHSYITKAVFDKLSDSAKYSGDKRLMWQELSKKDNVKGITIYRSEWAWKI